MAVENKEKSFEQGIKVGKVDSEERYQELMQLFDELNKEGILK